MANEEDPKKAAKACFDSIGLDPELYRIGHTKARKNSLCEYPHHVFHRLIIEMDPKEFFFKPLHNSIIFLFIVCLQYANYSKL
jgi:hypothetical protein